MRVWLWGAAMGLIVLGSTACGTGGDSGNTSGKVPANAQVVHVTAYDWKWKLDKTTVKAGMPVDFVVQSKEGTHGFSIVGTNVSQVVTAGDPPVNVVWTPKQPGKYTIRCNVFCGAGHDDMFTTITVAG